MSLPSFEFLGQMGPLLSHLKKIGENAILIDRRAWRATVHGVAKVRHDLATKLPPPPPHLKTNKFLF